LSYRPALGKREVGYSVAIESKGKQFFTASIII